jgi:hypothetical protein
MLSIILVSIHQCIKNFGASAIVRDEYGFFTDGAASIPFETGCSFRPAKLIMERK